MATIMIDSREATADKAYLNECRFQLEEAKRTLENLQSGMAQSWDGKAMVQCYDRLSNFIARIEELIGRSDNAARMLDTIVTAYREADEATAGKMRGGSW